MLVRRRQVAGKKETVVGTAESLAAVDADLITSALKVSPEIEMFERNEYRNSLTQTAKVVGVKKSGLSFTTYLKGSGSILTAPPIYKYMKACGNQGNTLEKMSIGAITNDPYVHGETITGSTSGATGRVIKKTANGASEIFFVTLTGTFEDAETITGGTSGATCTTSSAPSDAGFVVEPQSSEGDSLTIGSYEDGLRKLLSGCRGKFNIRGDNPGEPLQTDFEFMGLLNNFTDTPLLTGTVQPATNPISWKDTTFSLGGYTGRLVQLDLSFENDLEPNDGANYTGGIKSIDITGRKPALSMQVEMTDVATHDFFGNWVNQTAIEFIHKVGIAAGNYVDFYIPQLSYTNVEDTDRNGKVMATVSGDMVRSESLADTEYAILFT